MSNNWLTKILNNLATAPVWAHCSTPPPRSLRALTGWRSRVRRSSEPTDATEGGNWAHRCFWAPQGILARITVSGRREEGAQERRTPARKARAGRAGGTRVIMGAVFLCLINGRNQGNNTPDLISLHEPTGKIPQAWVCDELANLDRPGILPSPELSCSACFCFPYFSMLITQHWVSVAPSREWPILPGLGTSEGAAACPSLWRQWQKQGQPSCMDTICSPCHFQFGSCVCTENITSFQ